MNRIIKFRAFDTTNNVMAEIDELDGDFDFIKEGDRVRSTIRWQDLFNGDYPDVVAMQFTGLLDKNKKEIYEGDIILWGWGGDRDTGVIGWSKTHFGWEIGIPAAMRKSPGSLKDFWSDRIEVIGNIYEHHQLLTPVKIR